MNGIVREMEMGHRVRSAADVEADLQLACRAIGSLAGAARINATSIDRTALRASLEGLRHLLAEPMEGKQ